MNEGNTGDFESVDDVNNGENPQIEMQPAPDMSATEKQDDQKNELELSA